ncbi:DUF397 domain-containing protein [Saccharothrix saharensis]|uniref:DUF397 domain-containing protein n=1 Tax=Saccharothrix saharensis TaxID=571190 RepID=UPI0036CB50AF
MGRRGTPRAHGPGVREPHQGSAGHTRRSVIERAWRKSSRSASAAQCVELAIGVRVAGVRDTKNRDGGTLEFGVRAFSAFLADVKRTQV